MSGSSHAATCPRNPWRHWQARKRNSPALRSQDRDRLRRPRHPSQEKKTKRRSPPSPPEGPTISPTITSYTTTSDLTPRNKGRLYPADPPTVEEIVAVMREASDDRHGKSTSPNSSASAASWRCRNRAIVV